MDNNAGIVASPCAAIHGGTLAAVVARPGSAGSFVLALFSTVLVSIFLFADGASSGSRTHVLLPLLISWREYTLNSLVARKAAQQAGAALT